MFLRWGIPRRMIIPLRTFLSTVLFAISCLFINYGDLPSIFTTILLIGWAATSFLCPFLIIVLLYAIILRDQKNWAEWWQNIVYASIFTIIILDVYERRFRLYWKRRNKNTFSRPLHTTFRYNCLSFHNALPIGQTQKAFQARPILSANIFRLDMLILYLWRIQEL